MISHPLLFVSAWFGAARFSISWRQSSNTLPDSLLDTKPLRGRNAVVLTNVDVFLGTCFHKCTADRLGQPLALGDVNLSTPARNEESPMSSYSNTRERVEHGVLGRADAIQTPHADWRTHLCAKSHLDPTITHGMSVTPQKSIILSYTVWIMSKEFLDVIE